MTEEQEANQEENENQIEVNVTTASIDLLDKPAVFAIGHPRSGTSVSCQLLNTSDEVEWLTNTGEGPDNPYGFYEYGPFLEQSVSFIQQQWDITQAEEVNGVLQTMRHLENLPGTKILHAHSWYNWKQFFDGTKNLLIFRHPCNARKSLWNHRLNWPIDWYTTGNVQIGIYEDAENAVLVRFKRLMQEPERVTDLIEDELGLEVDPGVVDADEWHQKETDTIVGNLESMVFDTLCELEKEQYE